MPENDAKAEENFAALTLFGLISTEHCETLLLS